MKFVVVPANWKFGERIKQSANNACCEVMKHIIESGSLGIDKDGRIVLDIGMYNRDGDYVGITEIPLHYCPDCGKPVTIEYRRL